MRISDAEIKRLVKAGWVAARRSDPSPYDQSHDEELIRHLIDEVIAMPDRDELVQALKERIAEGSYRPSAIEIADAMLRRALADRIAADPEPARS